MDWQFALESLPGWLLKPIFSNLRSIGHLSVIFIDDSYLQGADFNLCVKM
jgi:hypothetical protein